jgi:hypothetical protein
VARVRYAALLVLAIAALDAVALAIPEPARAATFVVNDTVPDGSDLSPG